MHVWPVPSCKVPIMMRLLGRVSLIPIMMRLLMMFRASPPGSRGGLPGKNLSGTAAAASSAPPPLLFKLHLNPSDFLGWTMQGKIHTYLKR